MTAGPAMAVDTSVVLAGGRMAGAEALRPGEANRRCVRLADGSLLNRYWDERDTPREESYREDIETARAKGLSENMIVFRHALLREATDRLGAGLVKAAGGATNAM